MCNHCASKARGVYYCNCGEEIAPARRRLGYTQCLQCGERSAKLLTHCIVPMPKSNYIVVTDRALLVGLNSSHKGGTN